MDWNDYNINNTEKGLEMVLIALKAYSEEKATPVMRRQIKMLSVRCFDKIEFLQKNLLQLNNEFIVTFFLKSQTQDKTYWLRKNTINDRPLGDSLGAVEGRFSSARGSQNSQFKF